MSLKPLALVTCGPAYEPIDSVRGITNRSTGEVGTVLADALARAGFEVICLRGELATFPPSTHAKIIPFSTNASLLEEMHAFSPSVIFHAAALCDFLVGGIVGAAPAEKIRSDSPSLSLTLLPAPKILPQLRALFPKSIIVGWKYELDGSSDDAVTRGRRQIADCRTDACVVNGAAYGAGFGFLETDTPLHLDDKTALASHLAAWALTVIKP